MNKNIDIPNLELLKGLLKKIDPNEEVFVKGKASIDFKIKQLSKEKKEKK